MERAPVWVLQIRGPVAVETHRRWLYSQLDTSGLTALCSLTFTSRLQLVRWLRKNRDLVRRAELVLHPPEQQVVEQATATGVAAAEVREMMRESVWTFANQ